MIKCIALVAALWNVVAFFVIAAMFKPSLEFQPQGLRGLQLNRWPIENKTVENSATFGAHLVGKRCRVFLRMALSLLSISNSEFQSSARLIIWEVIWFISSIGGAFVVFRCEALIVRHFRTMGTIQSQHTRRMHQEFHRALLAMVSKDRMKWDGYQ